jgi:galactokinase
MQLAADAAKRFRLEFGAEPTSASFAPGRVEVLGNHTDYNGGYVLPAALQQGTVIVGRVIPGDTAVLVAADFDSKMSFSVSNPVADPYHSWASYVMGVVDELNKAGIKTGGFEAVIHSDVPTGAGLSSSASLEVATSIFLKSLYPYELGKMDTALLCQRAENKFVGVNCGIMDQFASVYGEEDSLLFLDCQTLVNDTVKMGRDDIAIVIANSGVKHALTGGDYNTRRAECMAAAAHFGAELLRDVSWDDFVAHEAELPENQRKRARHILTENARVLALRDAIRGTDADVIKRILAEGHASMRDLFENSTPELDVLVDVALGLPGCYGARMTGGGWGGATVNLVQRDEVEAFIRELGLKYKESTGLDATIILSKAGQGAHSLESSSWQW